MAARAGEQTGMGAPTDDDVRQCLAQVLTATRHPVPAEADRVVDQVCQPARQPQLTRDVGLDPPVVVPALTGAGLSYQISTESFTRTVKVWRDNLAAEAGHVVRTDGQLFDPHESSNPFPQLNAGDTITLFAGAFQVNASSPAFTLMPSGDCTMWVSSNNGYRVSGDGVSAVPVPAAAWLFGSGLLALAAAARRRQT